MYQQLLSAISTVLQFVYKIAKYNAITAATTTLTVIKPFFNNTVANLTNSLMGCTTSQGTKAIVLPVVRPRNVIPRRLRNNVWIKYQGNKDTGICYCCGVDIRRYDHGWHCSHVIADVKDGEVSIDNLRACCTRCNLSMGSQNLYAYIHDKQLKGPGRTNVAKYFRDHPSQIHDKRVNKRSIITRVDKSDKSDKSDKPYN